MAALVRALRLASASDVDVNALASEADRSLMLVSLADNALKEFIEAEALAEASL